MYDLIGTFSFVFLLFFNLLQHKRKRMMLGKLSLILLERKTKPKKNTNKLFESLLTVFETIIISVAQLGLVGTINNSFGNLVGTGSNYFGLLFIVPLILSFVFLLLGVDPFKQFDLITPAFPFALIFVKIACFCQGCCRGVECSFGLYNHFSDAVEFPVQLVESAIALVIFIFLMYWRKKAKEGTMYPTYLVIYSATRFFSEFLRCEPDIIWKLKTYHILCIIGIIVGVFELFIVKKFSTKISEFYDNSFMIIGKICSEFSVKKLLKLEKNIVHHKKRNKKNKKRLKNR